ncbi:unnamed protein product [Pedinophyceae sp. YPF-701]|nr:unnamed protein product [Pedinophyceae sp. YPF-701]
MPRITALCIAFVVLCVACAGILPLEVAASLDSSEGVREVLSEALPTAEEGATKLPLGSVVPLDSLGPVIVTTKGGVRRISNWAELSPQEKATALRRIAVRNRERIQALQEKAAAGNLDAQSLPESVRSLVEQAAHQQQHQTPAEQTSGGEEQPRADL